LACVPQVPPLQMSVRQGFPLLQTSQMPPRLLLLGLPQAWMVLPGWQERPSQHPKQQDA
jgi:hypothetical protein